MDLAPFLRFRAVRQVVRDGGHRFFSRRPWRRAFHLRFIRRAPSSGPHPDLMQAGTKPEETEP
jgi:hypothetical protein